MRLTRALAAVCILGLTACGAGTGTISDDAMRVEITKSTTALSIRGFDAQQVEVGSVHLTLGTFVDENFGNTPVYGRVLTILAGTDKVTHQSPGEPVLHLPLADQNGTREARAFVSDTRVAGELEQWGVTFELGAPESSATTSNEDPYNACTWAQSGSCGAMNCWQSAGSQPHQHVCCGTSQVGVDRYCVGAPSCSDGSTYGGGGCPSGMPVCPSSSTPSGSFCVTASCGAVGPLGCGVCTSTNWYCNCFVDLRGNFTIDDGSLGCM